MVHLFHRKRFELGFISQKQIPGEIAKYKKSISAINERLHFLSGSSVKNRQLIKKLNQYIKFYQKEIAYLQGS